MSIAIATATNRYGEPDTTTTVSTWGELLADDTGAHRGDHVLDVHDTTRLRIRYLDSYYDVKPDKVRVTVQGRELECRRIVRDPRRRWIVLELI